MQFEKTAHTGPNVSMWWHCLQRSERLKTKVSLFGVVLITCLSLLLQVRFIIRSDLSYLVTTRVQDDSFYYLQTAKMFVQTGRFTFDGLHVTYGFQPLWMLVTVLLAHITPNDTSLILATLVASSVLFCGTGLLLYVLAQRFAQGLSALVAPTLWLINPPLIEIYTTGKENSLYAFVLVLSLLLFYRLIRENDFRWHLSFLWGLLSGLLILSRINSIIVVLLFSVGYLVIVRLPWLDRLRHASVTLLGSLILTLPWFTYANAQLGSWLPNSGSRKLFGSWAALVLALHRSIPALPLSWLSALLPTGERVFLQSPSALVFPSMSRTVEYIIQVLLANSWRFWLEEILLPSSTLFDRLGWMPYGILVLLVLLSVGDAARKRLRERARHRVDIRRHLQVYSGIIILGLAGILNTSINCSLLPHYVFWATWYAVPETLFLIFGAALVIGFGLKSDLWHKLWNKLSADFTTALGLSVLVIVILIALVGKFETDMRPREYVHKAWYQHEAWEALTWMKTNLPKRARIGAWNSGLLGYFGDDWTVINLDGLANSPSYVNSVYHNYVLHYHDLTTDNELWEYIKSQRITYIADADFEANIGKRSFYRSIPLQSYNVVYRGQTSMDWQEQDGPRRFVVLKLEY